MITAEIKTNSVGEVPSLGCISGVSSIKDKYAYQHVQRVQYYIYSDSIVVIRLQ